MATFEDNTTVTLSDLNNIAIDLGDATFSSFSNEKFGVDKLNEITAALVSKGILTTGNRCEPIINDGKVYIKNGVIVFNSGAKIYITEPKTVDLIVNTYIYAYNNTLTGKASIEVGESEPVTGDYVMLAQIDGTGKLIDKRELSVAKALSAADFSVQSFENTIVYSVASGYVGNIELGTTALKRLVGIKITGLKISGYSINNPINCFYDFADANAHTITFRYINTVNSELRMDIVFTMTGSVLNWEIVYGNNLNNKTGDEITMAVDMI